MQNSEYSSGSPNILIGTPAYNCQVHTAYLQSILGYYATKLPFHLLTLGNESLVTRARNTIIANFSQMKQYTHLLFLDADVSLDAQGLKRLVNSRKDVIGATVPLKTVTAEGRRRYNMGEIISREGVIARTPWLGTAVMMLSRKAADALVVDAVSANRVYQFQNTPEDEPLECYDIFRVGVVDGVYLSEDFWVCHRLRQLGFDIHVDLGIKPAHHGMYKF